MSGRPSTGARFIRAIVKNDAVKQDPPEIYGWRAFAMAGSACFGGMLFGFDIGTIGGVLELKEFQMYDPTQFIVAHYLQALQQVRSYKQVQQSTCRSQRQHCLDPTSRMFLRLFRCFLAFRQIWPQVDSSACRSRYHRWLCHPGRCLW